MNKLLTFLFFALSVCSQAQTTQSITGEWTLSKVIKVEGVSAAELKTAKEALEGNVILRFNADGTFKSTADSRKEPKTWSLLKKKKTILIKGKSGNLKAKIISFKTERMRVKMQLSRSVLGEFVLVKN